MSLTSFSGLAFFGLLFVPACCQDRVRGANADSSDEIARLNNMSLPR
jgi:hypothetical protein